MGTYTNAEGKVKNCFKIRYNREVTGLIYGEEEKERNSVIGLRYTDHSSKSTKIKYNKHAYYQFDVALQPGEAVNTLANLGLEQAPEVGFAGPSLRLDVPIPLDRLAEFSKHNNYMEVLRPGVVLAWQMRMQANGKLFIGAAGTKANYGHVEPRIDEAFAKDRHLLQLNMVNDVVPDVMSVALGRNTTGQTLTAEDLKLLIDKKIAHIAVKRRAVRPNGFITVGDAHRQKDGARIANLSINTDGGSGGVSLAPASNFMNMLAEQNRKNQKAKVTEVTEAFAAKVFHYGSSRGRA